MRSGWILDTYIQICTCPSEKCSFLHEEACSLSWACYFFPILPSSQLGTGPGLSPLARQTFTKYTEWPPFRRKSALATHRLLGGKRGEPGKSSILSMLLFLRPTTSLTLIQTCPLYTESPFLLLTQSYLVFAYLEKQNLAM